MADRLITRPELNALERLEAFVAQARYDCAAFGTNLEWDRADWDVTTHCPRPVTEPSDVVCMSVIKLLHCAPWRIGEVLALQADCEVVEQKVDETATNPAVGLWRQPA